MVLLVFVKMLLEPMSELRNLVFNVHFIYLVVVLQLCLEIVDQLILLDGLFLLIVNLHLGLVHLGLKRR